LIPWLSPTDPFPPVSQALAEPAGLLAASDDLSAQRLIAAYRQGIFPWYNEGQPVLWWSTHPRMVLFTDELRVSHSLKKTLQNLRQDPHMEVRCDQAFETVMRACSAPRDGQEGTWISPAIIDAYVELHHLGLAHSVETWFNDKLVGGLYGVCVGKMFYGESMFTRAPNASKIALVHLVDFLRGQGCPMIDCQQETSHLASLGARPISREDFVKRLNDLVDQPGIARWPQQFAIS
jgi:leucyl/phenylalanyl-tRNA--protein transferase